MSNLYTKYINYTIAAGLGSLDDTTDGMVLLEKNLRSSEKPDVDLLAASVLWRMKSKIDFSSNLRKLKDLRLEGKYTLLSLVVELIYHILYESEDSYDIELDIIKSIQLNYDSSIVSLFADRLIDIRKDNNYASDYSISDIKRWLTTMRDLSIIYSAYISYEMLVLQPILELMLQDDEMEFYRKEWG